MCLPFSILLVPWLMVNSPPFIVKFFELGKIDIAVLCKGQCENGVVLYLQGNGVIP